jgi:hypothetical protein
LIATTINEFGRAGASTIKSTIKSNNSPDVVKPVLATGPGSKKI